MLPFLLKKSSQEHAPVKVRSNRWDIGLQISGFDPIGNLLLSVDAACGKVVFCDEHGEGVYYRTRPNQHRSKARD